MEKHRRLLAEQVGELNAILERRESLAREVEQRLHTLNKEKERLLQTRIHYTRRLQELRKQRRNTEAELASIVRLVSSLNLQIRQTEEKTDISKAKGTLPRPVTGRVRLKFNETAKPPVRGVTFSLAGDDEVQAVHWGKVVFNDIMRGLGRVVILAHGADYYSVYAFLAESPLRVGADVARADPIGKAGFVPSLNEAGLYFELRFHQKVINPEQWFRKPS